MSLEAYNVGKFIRVQPGLNPTTVPSSSGGATSNGLTIDRLALNRRYYSCKSAVTARLTGSTQQALSLAATFQHSSDGTSWDNFSTATNATGTVGSTGATGAQSTDGVVEQVVNLRSARRYVRQVVVPTFTLTTSGDNAILAGVVVFGGADENPSS